MSDRESTKISLAAILGAGIPSLNWMSIFDSLDPVLKFFLLIAQIAVAIGSFLYVLRKWKQLKKPEKIKTEDEFWEG